MPTEPTTGEPNDLLGRIRGLSQPMEPIPTGEQPRLDPLPNIQAVLFDIYGTLFISGSGDVGTHAATDSTAALAEAMQAVGLSTSVEVAERGVDLLHLYITESHSRSMDQGVERPEVDIRDIWQQVLKRLADEGLIAPEEAVLRGDARDVIEKLAVEYECRVNPVWPMPHLAEVLEELAEWVKLRELTLGLVSNAQFLTPRLFEALLGKPYQAFGFDEAACNFSYRQLEAKPSTRLYEPVAEALADREISPGQVLYVGNDMRNDIWPASEIGFRTALFAGDKRSLRWRENDVNLTGIRPDLILTDLTQLPPLLQRR